MGVGNGPWYIDDTLTFTVVTHRFDTGALTDADAVPNWRIYEDETGTAILTGTMAKLDDASTTGFYSEQTTLSAANGFEVGKSYAIYVTAAVNSVTGGQTFNFKVIAPAVAVATVAAIAADTAAILIDTAEIGVAGAGLTAIDLPDQTMNITGNLSGSVGSVTNVAAIQSGLATSAALATVDTVVDAIKVDTTAILAASGGGDPWSTPLPGAYAAGTAGYIVAAAATATSNVKTKTDSLSFTVAGSVDANIQYVNDVLVTGTGVGANKWGPG